MEDKATATTVFNTIKTAFQDNEANIDGVGNISIEPRADLKERVQVQVGTLEEMGP